MSARERLRELFGADRGSTGPAPVGGAHAIAVDGLYLSRGGTEVLRDVSLTVDGGEVVALVGPNGAGKSTLLAAVSRDLAYDRGSVAFFGVPLEEWTHGDLARHRAMLLQQNDLAFGFTVDTVVRMGRSPWIGRPEEDADDEAVDEAMAATDVEHLRHRPFTQLSGGERARASLARVAAQRTPVLLLDEPTASLDLQHQEVVLGLARRRADSGVAVLVVLHDLGLAGAYADRIAVMDQGRVVACGPPKEVLRADLLSAVYRQPVEVFPHPRTGTPVVVAAR